jgi:TRAP-type mannitol/chloroaromatic compound transport system substrate-binding protein
MSAWTIEGNRQKLMREFYPKYNKISLPSGNTGAQMGGWFRKEIKSVADLKGLKFRCNPFAGRVLEPFGVVPQSLPGADIYPALEKGTLDAAEWVGPYDDQKLGFDKVARNYYYPGWWEGGPQLDFFINSKAWDQLTPDYKAALETASAYAHVQMQARYDARNPAALKQLVGSGVKLKPFPADVMNAAFKSAQQIYSDLSARNPDWKRIYEDYSRFLAEQNVWFRFTEGTFDRFMQAQKL